MSEMWKLQAVQRAGFPGVWRAGRFWPSETVQIEVLDQEEDPAISVDDKEVKGGKRAALDPTKLGQASWRAVLADGRISKFRVGADQDSGDAAVELLKIRLKEALKRTAQLAGENEELRSSLADAEAKAEELQGKLRAQVADAPKSEPPPGPVLPGGTAAAAVPLDPLPAKPKPLTLEHPEPGPQDHGKKGGRK